MDDMEQKLNALLSDPQLMQKITSMAQTLGSQQEQPKPEGMPDIDLGMIRKLSGLASQSTIDKDQQTLLRALKPYLSRERISKLEKAMRAAKMAKLASGLMGPGGLLGR